MMILLFDSASRASELLNLRVCDVILGKTPMLKIFGKCSKTRIIPLMDETVAHFKNYMKVFHVNENEHSCCLPRKIQKIDKQNTKKEPPKS